MQEEPNASCTAMPVVYLLLGSLLLHAVIQHLAAPLPTSNALSLLAYALRSFLISSGLFAIYAAIPICVAGIAWVVRGKKRKHCVSSYIKNGIIAALLISLIMVYFSWYGSYRASQYSNHNPPTENASGVSTSQGYA